MTEKFQKYIKLRITLDRNSISMWPFLCGSGWQTL